MSQLQLVTASQAKILKELGFDWETDTYIYMHNEVLHNERSQTYNYNAAINHYSRPSVPLACTWLLSKGIYIVASPHIEYMPSKWVYEIFKLKGEEWTKREGCSGYDNYDEAMTAALDKALSILTQNTNDLK